MVGRGENSVFESVASLGHDPRIQTFIADIRDVELMRLIFEKSRPHLVIHAAAHKHVGFCEDNVPEAITNNVRGTQVVLQLVEDFQVERFVLISTDKAVNPSTIMGTTKRIAEKLVLESARRTKTKKMFVRFGNVLGSCKFRCFHFAHFYLLYRQPRQCHSLF